MPQEFLRFEEKDLSHQGSIHDSTAFNETCLNDLLGDLSELLSSARLFLVGDSAYALRSYLLTPYPNVQGSGSQDDFNFWHSKQQDCN